MKKNKIQYAQPIKVSDIKESWNPEHGYAGYDIEVIFKDGNNIPYPHKMDPEHIHCYTDLNGTTKVIYSFPFIGYGVINWGKLAAKHWANKMREQINPANLEPLYKLKNGKTMEFICGEKNRDCVIATLYFQNLKKFMDDLAENKSPCNFPTQEINCCAGENCPIWKNYVANLKQKIK